MNDELDGVEIFDAEPFAYEAGSANHRWVRWFWRARYLPEERILCLSDMTRWHFIQVEGEPTALEPGRFTARITEGAEIEVRPIEPGDSMLLEGFPRKFPFPLDVLKAQAAMTISDRADLQAVVDDDELVVTLLLITDIGMYARFSGAWQRIMNPADFLDGYTVEDVSDGAVEQWDRVDQLGKTLPVTELATPPPETQMATPPGEVTLPRTVAAAGEVLVAEELREEVLLPQIRVAEDVAAAIAVAEEEPEARWYVERRIRALGLEADYPLPWSPDA